MKISILFLIFLSINIAASIDLEFDNNYEVFEDDFESIKQNNFLLNKLQSCINYYLNNYEKIGINATLK